MVCFRHDETLPLASTGAGRSGTSVIGGDTANDNQIIDPAAAATLLADSNCIGCMVGIVGTIRGSEMTILHEPHAQKAICYRRSLIFRTLLLGRSMSALAPARRIKPCLLCTNLGV